MKGIIYVVRENRENLYRMFTIVRYEILADNRDSKLGMFWSILDPIIQIFAYWFAFGLGIRGGSDVNGIAFINWMLCGIIPWFFLSASIRNVTTSIHSKSNVITKMKFPVSILPTTQVFKELFTHIITLILGYLFIILNGVKPQFFNFEILYYMFCGIAFSISLGMVTSVLNMFTRDVKKAINASMRLLMYVTPILWTMDKLPKQIQALMKCNPLYYIIEGYRDSLLFYDGILSRTNEAIIFWIIVITLFIIGSSLMYKFKRKFIDFI